MKGNRLGFGVLRDELIMSFFDNVSMTQVSEVYLCEICGNKVKVLENGPGKLVCCGQPMKIVD